MLFSKMAKWGWMSCSRGEREGLAQAGLTLSSPLILGVGAGELGALHLGVLGFICMEACSHGEVQPSYFWWDPPPPKDVCLLGTFSETPTATMRVP